MKWILELLEQAKSFFESQKLRKQWNNSDQRDDRLHDVGESVKVKKRKLFTAFYTNAHCSILQFKIVTRLCE